MGNLWKPLPEMKKLTDCRLWSLDLAQNNYCIFQNCLVSSGTSVAMTGRCTDGHSVWLILLITSRRWASTQHRATLAEWMAPALCLNSVWVEMCSILQLHAVITFTIWCWRKHLADHRTVQWSRHSAIQAVHSFLAKNCSEWLQAWHRGYNRWQGTYRVRSHEGFSVRAAGNESSVRGLPGAPGARTDLHWMEVFQIVAWCSENWVTSIVHASPAAPANDMKLLKLLASSGSSASLDALKKLSGKTGRVESAVMVPTWRAGSLCSQWYWWTWSYTDAVL